jgi:hypothetical protein
MATQKVSFIPATEEIADIVPAPKPAKAYFPDWLQEMPNHWVNKNGEQNSTATQCMPFMDSFVTGYIQELPCDVEFTHHGQDNAGRDLISYKWAGPVRPVIGREERDEMPLFFPKFSGYYHADLQWLTMWEPKTPPGFSTFYHHPLNRFDLPFHTFNGFIDTDKWSVNGPLPFMLKEGFSGLLPAGTPMYQITFIKRDSWESSLSKFNEQEARKERYSVKRYLKGGYKKAIWERKSYK